MGVDQIGYVMLTALAVSSSVAFARDAKYEKAPYMDAARSVEERVEDLVLRISLAEKVAQLSTTAGFGMYDITPGRDVKVSEKMVELHRRFPGCGLGSTFRADWYSGWNWQTGLTPDILVKAQNTLQRYAVEHTRLGIPLSLAVGQMLGATTVPSGLGCAATWDIDAIAAGTRMRLRESATVSRVFGIGHPTCDLALDPRWSRVEQSFGEDPFLSAEINYIRCSTAKAMGGTAHMAPHFITHGASEGGRMALPTHAGDNELYNLHMRPFEYAVRGGCSEIMTCYNLVDGIPGGKLPISFPRAEGAIPCYYHALRERGNYVDMCGSARYPFGYGLSYTTFKVSDPELDGNRVMVKVVNTGKVKGDDVIQMYIRDVFFEVARPRYELKGFRRVTLEPGEVKSVGFELTDKELGYWNRAREYVVEPGDCPCLGDGFVSGGSGAQGEKRDIFRPIGQGGGNRT